MCTSEQKRKKRHVAIAQKLDLIEQNPCDFWIQHIRLVLNQLKNADNKFVVDQRNVYNGTISYNAECL